MPTQRQNVQSLEALNARFDSLQSDVGEIKNAMSKMVETLAKLASLEAQHLDSRAAITRAFNEIATTNAEIKGMQERMHQRQLAKDDQIRGIELKVPENLPERLRLIEVSMPGILEAQKWVTTAAPSWPGLLEMRKLAMSAVVAVVALVGLALIAIVVTRPSAAPATVVLPQPQQPEPQQSPQMKRPLWITRA